MRVPKHSGSPKAWEVDLARERPSPEELRALYRQYADEGHLVVFGHVRSDRPLDLVGRMVRRV